MKGLFLALMVLTISMFTGSAEASLANYGNRPQAHVAVGTAASKKIPVLYAAKKMKVLSAKLISTGAIAASGSNYYTVNLHKSALLAGVPQTPAAITGNAAVDTQLGVAAYGHLPLDLAPEIVLEAGETLYLDAVLTGTLTIDAHLELDYEIVGK